MPEFFKGDIVVHKDTPTSIRYVCSCHPTYYVVVSKYHTFTINILKGYVDENYELLTDAFRECEEL